MEWIELLMLLLLILFIIDSFVRVRVCVSGSMREKVPFIGGPLARLGKTLAFSRKISGGTMNDTDYCS